MFIVDFLDFLLLASGQIVDSDGQEDIEENVVAADEKHDEIQAVSHQLTWSSIFSLCFADVKRKVKVKKHLTLFYLPVLVLLCPEMFRVFQRSSES